jgi:hypothetical protein
MPVEGEGAGMQSGRVARVQSGRVARVQSGGVATLPLFLRKTSAQRHRFGRQEACCLR